MPDTLGHASIWYEPVQLWCNRPSISEEKQKQLFQKSDQKRGGLLTKDSCKGSVLGRGWTGKSNKEVVKDTEKWKELQISWGM